MNIIHDVPAEDLQDGWVALDLELCHTNIKVLHRPQGGDFALLSIYDGKDVYLIHDVNKVHSAIERLQNCTWIFHNAKFDLTHLRRWAYIPPRKKIWDTMLIEKILWSGFYDGFSLADLSRRYLDKYLDKSLQNKWGDLDIEDVPPENQDAMANLQLVNLGEKIDKILKKQIDIPQNFLDYAVNDVVTTYDVCMEQRKFVKKNDFWIWTHIDLPAMWAVMDFMGFRIDSQKWLDLSIRNKQRSKEIDAVLPFNPRSPKVSREYLSKRGFLGLPNTQESTLEMFINIYPKSEAAGLAKTCLESRKYAKRASTYGEKFIENHVEQDLMYKVDMVCGDFNIIGAETSRLSCSSPNMQNIPARDTDEFRECFIARPGNKLVIADFSQQEIGVVAYLSRDKKMLEAFNSGEDIYIQMAKLMYGKTIEKSDPLRKRMKSVVLGTNYGMSAIGLARKEKITEDEAQEFLDKFTHTFSGMNDWMNKQQKLRNYTQTILGRKTWLNPYTDQSYRNALNNPVQGSGAEILKLSLIEVHRNWKFDFPYSVVGVFHDEMVADVPENFAEDVGKFIQKTSSIAANNMCSDIPMSFRVDVSIGDNWSAK